MEMNAGISTSYKIIVFGANGGIGSQVVNMALQQGHEVTAIARNPESIKVKHNHLTIVKGDILQPETFKKYLEGKDVVISAIGQNSLEKTTLYSQGAKNLVMALGQSGSTRCYFISAAGLSVNPSHNLVVRFATKYVLQRILKNMFADLLEMETVIKQSDLDWTIVRPPRLTDSISTRPYRFSIDTFLENGLSISRRDVARFMLDNIENVSFYKSTVEVAY
jgi:putative NADH-flavin reductase